MSSVFCSRPLIAGLTLVIGCAVVGPSPAQKRKKVSYTKELRAFFKEVDKNYPFFKVKGITKQWKARKLRLAKAAKKCKSEVQFIELAFDAVRGLRDGHAGLVEIRPKMPGFEPQYYPGVVFLPASEGRVVVAAVPRALAKKLPVGSLIGKIDGKPARQYLDGLGAAAWDRGGHFSSHQRARFFEYRQPLRGKQGGKHVVEARGPGKQKKRKVTLRSQYPVKGWMRLYHPPADLQESARSVYHTTLADGTGYLWLRRMDETAESGVKSAIEAHPEVTRWIVDLRGNSGGGYNSSFKRVIQKLGKKVAVIIDAGAISAAETFTRDLVNVCKARIFGATSAGSSSSKKVWAFPSGIASVRYSVRSRSGVGGKPIEFHGITPDVPLEADPADIEKQRNTEIVTAQAWLQKQS